MSRLLSIGLVVILVLSACLASQSTAQNWQSSSCERLGGCCENDLGTCGDSGRLFNIKVRKFKIGRCSDCGVQDCGGDCGLAFNGQSCDSGLAFSETTCDVGGCSGNCGGNCGGTCGGGGGCDGNCGGNCRGGNRGGGFGSGLMNFFTDFIPDPNARGKCHRCCRWDELDCNGMCLHCNGRHRYLSAFGGWNLIGANNEFDVLDGMDNPLANGELNEGFIVGAAFGRRLSERTRGEFELAYRANSGDTLGPDPLDGHMNNWAVMFNLYREFRATENGLIPYIGGGIGLARQNGDFLTEADQNVDIRDEAFAFQAIVGAAKEVFEDGYLFGEYRYYGNTETDVRIFGVGDVADVQYQSQNFLFGFRWRY